MRESRVRADLLAWRPLRRVWRSPAFPVAAQGLALAAMLGPTVLGWAMLAALLTVAWRAWRRAAHAPAESALAARVGLVGSAALFGPVLAVWVWPGP